MDELCTKTEPLPLSLVLLPGLDGTGRQFREWSALARPHFLAVETIDFPRTHCLGYADLADFVAERLPRDSEFLLLAESFSGPLALILAAARPKGLRGLVLSTTFAQRVFPVPEFLSALLPAVPSRWLPMSALSALLLGRWSTPFLRAELRAALSEVDDRVLALRARETLRVDQRGALAQIAQPVLYLQARNDRLLPASALTQLRAGLPSLSVEALAGPHLLLQTQPQATLTAVLRWAIAVRQVS